jgi:2-polyprenyl-3-methyl-5-hydroxy-6-metoxy-1,4-benzoquinol methylase
MTYGDENENLVRDFHNAIAFRADPGEASCRTQGTTAFELRLMVRDVERKLEVKHGHRVLEIGCGVGVLAIPLARRASEYVGVDVASEAVEVLTSRFAMAGLDQSATAAVIDFISAPEAEIASLGLFDRVLVYATLHYVRTAADGELFIRRALALTRPGGTILFGNLPLDDLSEGIWPSGGGPRHRLNTLRWALAARIDVAGLEVSRWWRVRHLVYSRAKHRCAVLRRGTNMPPHSLPPGYVLNLTKERVEQWLARAPLASQHRWLLPAVGVPQYANRMDLVVTRRAAIRDTA